jgi:lipoprotein-anchoring transpeptidase ErfK/SrfK
LIGGIIIVLDWTLEVCLDLVQTKASKHDRGRLEWKADATLQLHRMAHEQVGSGVWSNATRAVPITRPGELLTSLDIQNKEHPRLASSEIKDTKSKVEDSAEDENTQNESALYVDCGGREYTGRIRRWDVDRGG